MFVKMVEDWKIEESDLMNIIENMNSEMQGEIGDVMKKI